jgi:hypothetical protein
MHFSTTCLIYLILLESINTIKRSIGALLEASKKTYLGINAEETMFMSHHQNAGKNFNRNTASKSFEIGAKFNHLGMTVSKLYSQRN